MRLSIDDLPMFFDDGARRARDAAARGGAGDRGRRAAGAHATEPERDRAAAAALAAAGLFELVVPAGGTIDTRALCLAREMLGYVSPRADSIFAVQGLGTHPIVLAGSAAQRAQLAAFARGAGIAAFALTEPEAGSDVAAIATRAAPTADGYRLDGDKLFISNLGIADHATVFATTDPALGAAGLTAFWVPLDAPGVTVKPLSRDRAAPDRRARAARRGRARRRARIGEVGQGMKLAMQTLDAFRVSVGAAAVGMARRALDEALALRHARASQFGKPLAEQPLVQAHLADMVVDLDAARLLVLRAAHRKDTTERPRDDRGLDRQARRDRGGAAGDRSRGPAVRRARRDGGRGRRAPVSRDPPAADLRGHERDPAHDHRPRARARSAIMTTSVTFPDDFNLADYFLFDRVREGKGDKVALRFGDRAWTYAEVADRVARARALPRRRRAPRPSSASTSCCPTAAVRVEHLRHARRRRRGRRWATRSRRPTTSRTCSTTCARRC